jgi:hypothetical protein
VSRVSGFKKAMPGRIHLRCPRCGRKQSNADRHPEHDHPTAYLLEIHCENCSMGCKVDGGDYYTRQGRPIDYWRWWQKRERQRERLASGGRPR